MKVGILTLPLHFNFGGILQAYALQETIRELGFDSYIVTPASMTMKQRIKTILYSLSGVGKFVRKHISYIELDTPFSCTGMENVQMSSLIVGSDQVWRPCMGNDRKQNVKRYFLQTEKTRAVKKIAYAASFGVDYWDFTEEETSLAQCLSKDFTSISVREESGVRLCNKYLGINNAVQVLDPTMLIDVEKYRLLFSKTPFKTKNTHCFVYLLDYNSNENKKVVESLLPQNAETLTAKVERNVLKKFFNVTGSVEKWLASIYNSDLVVTDSFHGCVFSILFHKDFYVMGNSIGGNARIQSLLALFHLEHRYVIGDKPFSTSSIDWNEIDNILMENKEKSYRFLRTALSV